MVIFHSYVSLPEGTLQTLDWARNLQGGADSAVFENVLFKPI
jgi:hypothetical protein